MKLLKLYSPISGFLADNETDELQWLTNSDLLSCIKEISQEIREYSSFLNKRGLIEYFDRDEGIKEKVDSAFPSVEVYKGSLYCVMIVKIKDNCDLTSEEIQELKDFCEGQYSDGWGEGFEQQEIKTGTGNICVSVWSSDYEYFIKTDKEMEANAMNREQIKNLKEQYPKGTRVELSASIEDEDGMPTGLQGTVIYVDDLGGIGVDWDNGRTLSIIPEVDSFKKLEIEQDSGMKLDM